MTAKIETEFIFETNIYFISAQKIATFVAIGKLLQYRTLDEIRWNPHLRGCQQAHEPLKCVLGDIKAGVGDTKAGEELGNSWACFLFGSEFHHLNLLHISFFCY